MDRPCIVCGLSEEEHHHFIAAKLPEGCICAHDGTWGDPLRIPKVCASFTGEDGVCSICEHDYDCHVEGK